MPTPPPLPKTQSPDWMQRNWKWLIPLICLAVLVGIGGFAALFVGINSIVKSSDAYSGAVVRAKSSPAVIAALDQGRIRLYWKDLRGQWLGKCQFGNSYQRTQGESDHLRDGNPIARPVAF